MVGEVFPHGIEDLHLASIRGRIALCAVFIVEIQHILMPTELRDDRSLYLQPHLFGYTMGLIGYPASLTRRA